MKFVHIFCFQFSTKRIAKASQATLATHSMIFSMILILVSIHRDTYWFYVVCWFSMPQPTALTIWFSRTRTQDVCSFFRQLKMKLSRIYLIASRITLTQPFDYYLITSNFPHFIPTLESQEWCCGILTFKFVFKN